MVLKSAFLLAVSASLVLTTQAAPTMRDTPLYKRNSAEKEINKALLDQKVADCVAKSVGLGEDRSSAKYVEQVLACKNIANGQSGAQDQAVVDRFSSSRDLEESLRTQEGPGSQYDMNQQVAPGSQYGKDMNQQVAPGSQYGKDMNQQVAPDSQYAKEQLDEYQVAPGSQYGKVLEQKGSGSQYA
ncbi:hypothetical protein [Absidia glauca]|uniref:Uncharacterized protein n=1 Tax=Absidia glauca TaxID=4829 RepID=A0A168KL09_ABSGL|nr:hypothetical protein [Absidia glauca]